MEDNAVSAMLMSQSRSLESSNRSIFEAVNKLRINVGIIDSKMDELKSTPREIGVINTKIETNVENIKSLKVITKEQDVKIWKIIVYSVASGASGGILGMKILDLIK